MKKILALLFILFVTACSNSTTELKTTISLDSLANRFIKDSISNGFEFPASYQFVSMNADTLTGIKSDKQLFTIFSESIETLEKQKIEIQNDALSDSIEKSKTLIQIEESISNSRKQIEDLKTHPSKPDSIFQINIDVRYKEKIKSGSLVARTITLIYYPKEKRFVEMVGE